ncbi:MAG TPA: metalloregulator ArsR/SmtB family transcription factor [Longimicrobiaceae bacterium]|nr:metalloregulator ArsR/SmtB family transcription factor [Longimicrobiaceae bacterium]
MDRDQFARIAKALADPRRFEILERIAGRDEVPCKHLVETFPISQATISHHLKELAAAGLIEVRREAQCCHYRPRSEVIAEYLDESARRLGALEPAR